MRVWPPKHIYCRPILRAPRQWCGIRPSVFKRRVRCFVQYGLLIFVGMVLVLLIGKVVQDEQADQAPSTLIYYQTPKVCGLILPPNYQNTNTNNTTTDNTSNSTFAIEAVPPPIGISTFDSEEDARSDPNVIVGHCGDCGKCSNPHDVLIYDKTKNTMLETATDCAKRGLIFGRKTASRCMDKRVGFTSGCNECWVENIMCDLRYCVFTCFWNAMFSRFDDSSKSGRKKLNPCTTCDEKRCGPAFIRCAGANRRRLGILSDIERDVDQEVCAAVDPAWWQNDELRQYWKSTSGNKPAAAVAANTTTTKQNDNTRRKLLRP